MVESLDYGYNYTKLVYHNNERYVVKYVNEDWAKMEVMADKIYKILNIAVPKSFYTSEGRYSEYIKGTVLCDIPNKLSYSSDIKNGFMADCLIDNYDCIGIGDTPYSNIIVSEDNNLCYRIDNGSSFIYRGSGGKKDFNDDILYTIDDYKNNNTGRLRHRYMFYKDISDADIIKQSKIILQKKDEIINLIKNEFGYNEISKIINERIKNINIYLL
jgi:hypothetical protein